MTHWPAISTLPISIAWAAGSTSTAGWSSPSGWWSWWAAHSWPRGSSPYSHPASESRTPRPSGPSKSSKRRRPHQAIVIPVFSHDTLTVHDPAYEARARTVLSALAQYPGVARIDSYFSSANENLVSPDGRTTYASSASTSPSMKSATECRRCGPCCRRLTWTSGSPAGSAIFSDINDYTGRDLRRAEVITFPLVALALLVIFRTVVSVAAPLAIGLLGLGSPSRPSTCSASWTSMSVFALNTATLLGVGAAIDYSLLMVSRFRKSLKATASRRASPARSVWLDERSCFPASQPL